MAHQHLFSLLKKELEGVDLSSRAEEVGRVVSVGDGVVQIEGLPNVVFSEMVEIERFPTEKGSVVSTAVVLNLEEYTVGAVVLGSDSAIREGDLVRRKHSVLSVPVGEELVGRVLSPLGAPLDGRGALSTKEMLPIERSAPPVMDRQPVKTPLNTGIKAIDATIPIGRGQRELIIGDRQLGKTTIVQDTILNQLNEPPETRPICVYVAIGQKASKVAQFIEVLKEKGAMEYTIVVAANASDPAPLWYIAPYAGCSMAEYFRDKGKDVLIIYDDLSKHAWAWRQLALLLRRPPGREAYPGDVFYLHSRLLERAARLSEEKGGGSLTALPLVETQLGDISAYIPTNVISITDGQIFLENSLFSRGQRPAIHIGSSVSRVGSSAQTKAMKKVASQLKLELAQFEELRAFVQFAQDLDEATKKRIERGTRLTLLLRQGQGSPLPMEEQVCVLFAGTAGFLDTVPVEKVGEYEVRLLEELRNNHGKILKAIQESREFGDETAEALRKVLKTFSL